MIAPVVRESRGEQSSLQVVDGGAANGLPVKRCAVIFERAEALASQRIIDQAENHFISTLKGDGDTEMRVAMGEVSRAVERVNDPAVGTFVTL